MTPKGLDCTVSGRVLLPYAPAAEYDLRFTVIRKSGGDSFAVLIPLARGTLVWAIGGMHGFAQISGNNSWGNLEGQLIPHADKGDLTNGVPHACMIRVRKNRVQAFFDDKLDFEIETDGTGLDNDVLKIDGQMVIGFHTQDTATITAAEISEVTGRGHVAGIGASTM